MTRLVCHLHNYCGIPCRSQKLEKVKLLFRKNERRRPLHNTIWGNSHKYSYFGFVFGFLIRPKYLCVLLNSWGQPDEILCLCIFVTSNNIQGKLHLNNCGIFFYRIKWLMFYNRNKIYLLSLSLSDSLRLSSCWVTNVLRRWGFWCPAFI